MSQKLNTTTKQMIKDLQDDLEQMLEMDSNCDVIWKLEDVGNNKAFQKSIIILQDHIMLYLHEYFLNKQNESKFKN